MKRSPAAAVRLLQSGLGERGSQAPIWSDRYPRLLAVPGRMACVFLAPIPCVLLDPVSCVVLDPVPCVVLDPVPCAVLGPVPYIDPDLVLVVIQDPVPCVVLDPVLRLIQDLKKGE